MRMNSFVPTLHDVATVNNDVLIVASADMVGMARLPSVLHHAGLRVSVWGCPGLAVGHSRFVQHYYRVSDDPTALLSALRQHLQERPQSYRWIILADDPLFWAAVQQTERTWMATWFPVALLGEAPQRLASKLDFLAAAEARGLPVPRFQVCETPTEAHAAAPRFGYPLALKTPYGFSGSAFRFVRDPDDLLQQANEFEVGQAFLVQEFIDGEVGATPALFDHGRPMCWFSYRMLDSWPHRFAAASALTIVDHPDVEPLLVGVGALTGFHGLGAIDWVREPRTGRLLLLEFNPRPTPALYAAPFAGVDFSMALKGWLAGVPARQKPQPQLARSQPRFMFPQHLYFALEHCNLRNFLTTWRDAPWDDPLLVLAHVRRVMTHFLPAEWRRRGKTLRAYLSGKRLVAKEPAW